MGESKSSADAGTSPEQIDKSASDINQEDKEKYKSEPEEKAKLGDYLVCIHRQSFAECTTNLHLPGSESSLMLQNGILYC